MTQSPVSTQTAPRETAPSLPLMHAAFVLAGLGTLLLGPILPLLERRMHLADSQAGLLLLAQFCGATAGGSSTSQRLRSGLMLGLFCAAAGFYGFALAPSLLPACAALVVAGFGVGRVVATINILAGARYTAHRGSVLSWLNFSWSFGALLSPLSAAWLASRFPLPVLLSVLATLFVTMAAALWLQSRHAPAEAERAAEAPLQNLPGRLFLYFCALLLLYGGLETCLSGWLTTYALRYGKSSLVLSEYTTVLFLIGLTAGRALSARLLLRMSESLLQRIALGVSALLAAALAAGHSAVTIATAAVLLGVALAPIFPATFAIVLGANPPARQAGIILAASGIGAASLPWLIGVISTRSGSLQLALLVPVATALAMLALTLWRPAKTTWPGSSSTLSGSHGGV